MPLSAWLKNLGSRFSSRKYKPTTRRFRHRRLPLRLEHLEDRTVPALFTVNIATDPLVLIPGQLSLRQAIQAANANGTGHDDIVFNIPGGAPQTITLSPLNGALPAITTDLTIDGTTQPGYTFGVPAIQINMSGFAGMTFAPTVGNINFVAFGLDIFNAAGSGMVVQGFNNTNNITFQDIISHNNSGDGINIFNVGTVNFTSAPGALGGVSAYNNVGGLTVNRATSLSITDGRFFQNDDGGIRISDISGNVTLTRTRSIDNNFDSDLIGSGFEATDGADADDLAIGGNLIVRGGSYSSTPGPVPPVSNFVGFYVQKIGGTVTFENSTGIAEQVTVTGNVAGGVIIQDGGTGATFTNGNYSDNGGVGLAVYSISGPATFSNVTANDNDGHGLDVDAVTTLTITNGSFRRNGDTGIALDSITGGTISGVFAQDNEVAGLSFTNSAIGAAGLAINGLIFNETAAGNVQDFGLFFQNNSGSVTITGSQANGNDNDGLYVENHTGSMSISSSTFMNNADAGLRFENVGSVITNGLTVTGNDVGLTIAQGTSFSDSDSTISSNNDGGIFLRDISGAVTLVRTRADDNDNDGDDVGDGLRAEDGVDGGLNAIGSLLVQGGSFSIVNGSQENGIVIGRVQSDVTFQNSGTQQVIVDNNDNDGVVIGGGVNATFTNGRYTGNDGLSGEGDGIRLTNFTGAVTFTNVFANGNADEGIDVDGFGTANVNTITATNNDGDGIRLVNGTTVNVTGGSFNLNGGDGLEISDISGNATLTNVRANQNTGDGLDVVNVLGTLTVSNVASGGFDFNGDNGLELDDIDTIILQTVNANLNGNAGVDATGFTTATINNSDFNSNLDNGIVLTDGTDVDINDTTASLNSGAGLVGSNITGTFAVVRSLFNQNNFAGIDLFSIGDVSLDAVTANRNFGVGIILDTANSFSDVDGTYQQNLDHGIFLVDIFDSVSMLRTRAEDNDFNNDNTGNGLLAIPNINALAIGGDLTIADSFFNNTIFAGSQVEGIAVSGIGGSTLITNTQASNNEGEGLFLEDGQDATIIGGDYSNNGFYGINLDSFASTVDISDVSAVGNSDNGIELNDIADDITISNVIADDNGGEGIDVSASNDVSIADTSASDNDSSGVSLFDVGNVALNAVTANNNVFFGLLVSIANAVTISGFSEFSLNGVSGAFVARVTSFSDSDGSYLENDEHGIHLRDVSGNVTLTNTVATDNDANNNDVGDGLFADAELAPSSIGGNLTVRGGDFSNSLVGGPQEFGIRVLQGAAFGVAGNVLITFSFIGGVDTTAIGNEQDGIFIDGVNGSTSITSTIARNNGGAGIVLDDIRNLFVDLVDASENADEGLALIKTIGGTGDVTINNSTFDQNGADGVSLNQFDDLTVNGVTASDNGDNGLDALGSGAGSVFSIGSSTFTFNGDDGLEIANAGSLTVNNVTASDNVSDGLELGDGGNVNLVVVSNSTFNNNGSDGIDEATFNGVVTMTLNNVTANANDSNGVFADDMTGVNTVTGGSFSSNGADGLNLSGAGGGASLLLNGTGTASNNGADGLFATAFNAGVTITGTWTFNNNGGDGVEVTNSGAVAFTNVTANGNDPGANINTVASFSDTNGTYSNNDNHGILLTDINGNVTLIRTTADNNDADNDGVGDGVRAVDGSDANVFAISGNLLVQGARFRDTGGANDHQEFGFFAQGAVAGSAVQGTVTFQDSAGPVQSMIVTGNETEGVNIDGGTIATFTNGTYSNNGIGAVEGDGLELTNFTLATITNVTANGNGDDGIQLQFILTVTMNFVTTNNNGDRAFAAANIMTVNVSDLVDTGNGSGLGGRFLDVVTVNFTTTTTPANVADIVELFPVAPGPEGFQHTRAGSVQQRNTLENVTTLNIFFLDGDDEAIINAGPYTLTNLLLDGGPHIVGDTLTYNATNGPDLIDLNNTVVTINGVAQPGGIPPANVNIINFELLAINGLDGDDTFTVTDWPSAGQFAVTTLNGNNGNDSMDASGAPLEGVPGSYVMNGNDGNDTILGSPNAETITGGNDDDRLIGNAGNDTILGNAGNDFIEGGAGNDSLVGGTGSDTYSYGVAPIGPGLGSDTITEAGVNIENDWLDFLNFVATNPLDLSGITVDLGVTGVQEVNPGDVSITLSSTTAVENVRGSAFADNITGNTANNTLLGMDGADLIIGLDGNDTIDGGLGNDTLIGGLGNDSIHGDAGNDTIDGGAGNDTTVGGAGDDWYLYAGLNLGSDSVDEAANVDTDTLDFTLFGGPVTVNLGLTTLQAVNLGNLSLQFSTATGLENVEGSTFNDVITGNSRDNLLNGNDGNDSIQGSTGNDTVNGGDGNDTLRGGPATILDFISGGAGNDLIVWDPGDGSQSIDGNAGTDTVQVNGGVASEEFTLAQDGVDPTRQDFDRIAGAPAFNLDVGTVEVYDVNMGVGNDTITTFLPISGPGNGDVTTLDIDGGADNDLIRFDFTTSNILPATTVVSGGTGSDTVRLEGGGAAFTTETYNSTGPNSGNVNLDGQVINYSQLERLQQTKAATNLIFNATNGDDSIGIVNGPTVNGFATSSINSLNNLFVGLDFANKTNATVFGLLGSDTMNLTNLTPAVGLTQWTLNGGTNALPLLDLDTSLDVFRVQPTIIPVNVNGGNPVNMCPGDSLEILPPNPDQQLTLLGKYDGFYTFSGGLANINFTSIEDFPGIQIIVTGTDFGTTPRIRVYNALDAGPTAAPILNFKPFPELGGFSGGVRVAAGDVNGDCYPDIIAAAGPGNGGTLVRVFDGYEARQGNVVQIGSFKPFGGNWNKGLFVAVGDLDSDGFGDLVVSTGGPAKPRVRVFRGSDVISMAKPPKQQFEAFPNSFKGGCTVAVGDYDGDGNLDIVCGAGPTGTPRVRVFDGTSFALIDDFLAFDASHKRGIYVGTADVDNDGIAEIIVTRNASGLSEIQPFDLQISPALNVKPEARTFDFTVNQGGSPKFPTASREIYPPNYTSGIRVGGWSDGGNTAQFLAANGPGVSPSLVKKLDAALTDTIFTTYPGDTTGYFVAGSQRRFGLPLP